MTAGAKTQLASSSGFALTSQIYVNTFGADPTNTFDSTAAFTKAINFATNNGANPTAAYQLVGGVGTYLLPNGIPTVFARHQSYTAPGSGLSALNHTGTGTCIVQSDAAQYGAGSIAGPFSGFRIVGTANGTAGFQYGDMIRIHNTDIVVQGYTGAGTFGYYGLNTVGLAEEAYHQVNVINCLNSICFDTHSFDYSTYFFYVNVFINQGVGDILTIQNGAQLVGGNGFTLAYNAGTQGAGGSRLIAVDPAGTGPSIVNTAVNIVGETDGAGTGHIPVFLGNAGSQWVTTGKLMGLANTAKWGASTLGSNGFFSHSPHLSFNETTPQLGQMSLGDTMVIYGGVIHKQFSNLAGNWSGSLNLQFADTFHFRMGAATVIAPAGDLTNARSVTLYLVCNNGGANAVTWPTGAGGGPIFAGNVAPVMSTVVGHIDVIRLDYSPTLQRYMVIPLLLNGT